MSVTTSSPSMAPLEERNGQPAGMSPGGSPRQGSTFRERHFKALWALLWPVRAYIKHFPFSRGKGLLLRSLIFPCFPPAPATVDVPVPGGLNVGVLYRDALGWASLMNGPFEWVEMDWIRQQLNRGHVVMDVGANLGLYTVMLASAVGPQGRVIAVEPVPGTRAFAEANVTRNGLDNVEFVPVAVGDHNGTATLNLSNDTGFTSLVDVADGRGNGKTLVVPLRTLDSLWQEHGHPLVRFVKIDVEGAEPMVLSGADALLNACHPMLLLEANTQAALQELERLLSPYGYTLRKPPGFSAHNYLAMAG